MEVTATYGSNVQNTIRQWNMDAPTGVLGLGIALTVKRIRREFGQSPSDQVSRLYLDFGDHSSEMVCNSALGDTWSFQCLDYNFWRITYTRSTETWTIVKDDGNRFTFGGKASGRNTVEYGVRWGNWVGPSAFTVGQTQFATGWLLAEVTSLWGDWIRFTYEQETDSVGGAQGQSYTRASYLAKQEDLFGRCFVYTYADKYSVNLPGPQGQIEVQPPHSGPVNVWQDRYESRFLQKIEAFGRDRTGPQNTISFAYDFVNLGPLTPSDVDYGYFWKRILVSITETGTEGSTPPGLQFAYYRSAADIHPGALKTVTYPSGAIATYTYRSAQLANSQRAAAVQVDSNSDPRVWYGPDYAVVTEYVPGRLQAKIWNWSGTWMETPAGGATVISANVDASTLRVVAGEDWFAIAFTDTAGTTQSVHLLRRDPTAYGNWTSTNRFFPITGGKKTQVVSGDGFVLLYNAGFQQRFIGFYFDWRSGGWSSTPVPDSTVVTADQVTMTAFGNYVMVAGYKSGATRYQILYLTADGRFAASSAWSVTTKLYSDSSGTFYMRLVGGDGVAASTWVSSVTGNTPSTVSYSLQIFQWNDDFAPLGLTNPVARNYTATIADNKVDQPIFETQIIGSTVFNSGHALRYGGGPAGSNNPNSPVRDHAARRYDAAICDDRRCLHGLGRLGKQLDDPDHPVQPAEPEQRLATAGAAQRPGQRPLGQRPMDDERADDLLPVERWGLPPHRRDGPLGQDPDTLRNRAPLFLATEATNTQSSVVLTLESGRVRNTPGETLAQQRIVGSDQIQPGQELVGPGVIATVPAANMLADTRLITLHRVIDGAVQGSLAALQVASVTIDTGYGDATSIEMAYDYDLTQVRYDAANALAQYSKVRVVPGTSDPAKGTAGSRVMYYSNGVSTNGGAFYPIGSPYNYGRLLNGQLLRKEIRDAQNALVSGTTHIYAVFPLAGQPGVSGTQRIAGAWSRLVEVDTEQDGITKKVRNQYDMASGLLHTSQTYFTDSDGTLRVITEEVRYAFQVDVYQSAFTTANFLQAEAQRITWTASAAELGTLSSGYGTIAAGSSTLWSNAWSPAPPDFAWAVAQYYRLAAPTTDPGFSFSTPPSDGSWILASQVTRRSWPGGAIVEQTNSEGMAACNLYDSAGIWLVARFENAALSGQEASYTGFEPTEQDAGWRVEPGGGPVPVTEADSNTGTTSMVVPGQGSGTAGPALTLTPADQTRRYVLSCFVKVPAQFAGEPGTAVWRVGASNGSTPVGSAVELAAVPDGATEWTYLFGVFDLPAFRTANNVPAATRLALTFKLVNGKSSAVVGVDNLRISPLDCVSEAQAVDPQTMKVTATTGTNGEVWRHLYDDFGQLIGINGPNAGPSSIEQNWLSRGSGSFDPAKPNRKLQIAARNTGRYERFRTADWRQSWSSTAPADWTAGNGALAHIGNSASTITFTAAGASANRAARVRIDSGQAVPPAPVSLGIAGAATLAWNPQRSPAAGFELTDGSGTVLASCDAAWPGSQVWVLIVQDGAAAAFAGGRLVAAAALASAAAGEAVLGAGSNGVRFREAMVIEAPIVSTEFSDATGRAIQRQLMASRQSQVSQMLYDKLEHQIIETKSALVDPDATHPLLAYREDFAVLAPATMQLTGIVATAWPDDGGYPYRRRTYCADPLARVTEIGAPGAAFAIIPGAPTGHTATLRYGPNDGKLGLAPSKFAGNWTRGQDNVTQSAVMNELGAELAVGTETAPGSGVYTYSHTEIDGMGRAVRVKPPNYFAPPPGSAADDWVSTTAYDMLGRIIEIDEPRGRGKTTYVYDIVGRVRFLQGGQDAADGHIAYFRYDLLGRLVEQGCMTAAWNRAVLQQQADDPAQPSGAASVWRRRLAYDGDGTSPYAIGRVCTTRTRDAATGSEIVESYTWDIFGNLATETTQAAAFDGETRIVASLRDRLNNPVTVTVGAGGNVLATLTYAYDVLGRLVTIGDGTAPDAFARYAYNADSRIVTEALGGASSGLAVNYGYAPPGWPASINATARGAPRFSEILSFTSGGAGTPGGYFSSLIAKAEFTVGGTEATTRFAYDTQARVTVAEDSRNGGWTIGEPQAVTYDGDFEPARPDAGQPEPELCLRAGQRPAAGGHGGRGDAGLGRLRPQWSGDLADPRSRHRAAPVQPRHRRDRRDPDRGAGIGRDRFRRRH